MDVPAHVLNATVIENHVQVQGGTNWDLSRGAVETPTYALADPVPVKPTAEVARLLDAKDLVMRIHFAKGSSHAPADLSNYLKKLPHGAVLALRAAPLAGGQHLVAKRLQVVRQALENAGFVVVSGASVSFKLESNAKSANTVELFLITP